MEAAPVHRPFNTRAFISVALLISGAVLPVSGIMNHTLQFEPMTMQRHLWMAVHNISALIFCIMALWHIVLHRKSLWHYAERAKGVLLSREAGLAIVLVCSVVGLFASHALHVP